MRSLLPILETPRLTLRPLAQEDIPSIQSIAADYKIADTTFIPHPYPDREAERYVLKQLYQLERDRCLTLAIALKPDSFIGVIEIGDIDQELCQAEIGFWLGVEWWGQGYMTEALKSTVEYSFEVLKFNRLYAYHLVRNPSSGRVLQKNGFMVEKLLPQKIKKWGIFEDLVLLSILRSDFETKPLSST